MLWPSAKSQCEYIDLFLTICSQNALLRAVPRRLRGPQELLEQLALAGQDLRAFLCENHLQCLSLFTICEVDLQFLRY